MAKTTTTQGANAADVRAIHKRLKEIVRDEIENLPGLLAQLPAGDRVTAILDLMEYCAPKIEKVKPDFGEGKGWAVDW